MILRTASVVSLSDLEAYFKEYKGPMETGGKPSPFKVVKEDGGLGAVNGLFSLHFEPKGAVYHVEVHAVDDPSDSDESTTDEPLKFIGEFTGVSIRASVAPDALMKKLRSAAVRLRTGGLTTELAAKELRRALAALRIAAGFHELDMLRYHNDAPNADDLKLSDKHGQDPDWNASKEGPQEKGTGPSARPSGSGHQGDSQREVLSKLSKDMRAKGWEFHEDEGDAGLPALKVNIGDEFEAKISVESTPWSYSFSILHTDVSKEGVADDPLVELRKFFKSEEVAKAKEELRNHRFKKKPDPNLRPEEETNVDRP